VNIIVRYSFSFQSLLDLVSYNLKSKAILKGYTYLD